MKQTHQIKLKRYKLNAKIAFDALLANKSRSFLSALGVIFGAAAVICMLSIGKGTEQEILDQIKKVGANNIVINTFSQSSKSENENSKSDSGKKDTDKNQNSQNKTNSFSPGLRIADLEAITEIIPDVVASCPYIERVAFASCESKYTDVTLKAVSSQYFPMFNFEIREGNNFNKIHEQEGSPVCIISQNAKHKLLGAKQAIGKKIRVDKLWYTVIGTIKNIYNQDVKDKNTDLCVYIPVQTFLLRIENNALIKNKQDYHGQPVEKKQQLDKIIVQVSETEKLLSSSKIIQRILLRKHNNVQDFTVEVPELLLKQQEETKSIFNIVLGIIAGISLLVGGIGIMNIMNASVLERTREIGVRLAIGANNKDIRFQFLAEAVFICLLGGIVGVIFGITMSFLIMQLAGIKTILSLSSIVVAFFVTTLVGVFFGYYPANKASKKDPIESLRYE